MTTIHTQAATVTADDSGPGPLASAALLAAETIGAEVRYRLQLGREMFWRGYLQAEDDMAARWDQIARPAITNTPSHAELELRRWGPLGRAHFADPQPGDFPGRRATGA